KHQALWEADGEAAGFEWLEVDNAFENVLAFRRRSPASGAEVICVSNLSPIPREGHRIGLPRAGAYQQILNTDSGVYCGGGFGVVPSITAEQIHSHGLGYSAAITLPPLATMWFAAPL